MNQSPMHQAARYLVVGIAVLAADFAMFWSILLALPGDWLAANIAGKTIGAALGFILHKHFTFGWLQKDAPSQQLVSYIGLFLFNLALSSGLLWLLVDRLQLNELVAKLMADAVVIGTSFLVSRTWIYRAA